MNVYEQCPVLQNEHFLLRLVEEKDCADLLKVYSDQKAAPLFNSDNCHGDDFCYQTMERMAQAIRFWLFSYQNRFFVRWSIVARVTGEAIGTIELFHRDAGDSFTDTGLLRLDLRSDYEREEMIGSLLDVIAENAFELFECSSISTKAVLEAQIRRAVLLAKGYEESSEVLTGDDGKQYGSYFVFRKDA